MFCTACSQAGQLVGSETQHQLDQPSGIQVLFNHRRGARYLSPLSGEWRNGDDLEQLLLDSIGLAKTEILVAIQDISLPSLATALIVAKQRGVEVRVILENTYSSAWSEQQPTHLSAHQQRRWQRLWQLADRNRDGATTDREAASGDAVAMLKRAGVSMLDDTADGSRGSGLMHHKFIVIDRGVVITGSANLTSSGIHGDAGAPSSRGNVNHLLRFESPGLATLFHREFNRMWGDGPGGQADSRFGLAKAAGPSQTVMVGEIPVEVLFPPHSKRDPNHGLNWLADQLRSAGHSIDLALFVFSAQQLTDVLSQQAAAGVQIRLVADPGFASRPFSEVLDLLGVALPDHNCKLEQNNQPLEQPLQGVGIPKLARGDKLHHKFAVIDNRKVITGSFNWSPSAAHNNDETLLVIHSPQLAEHFTREMDRLWDGAALGITPHLQRKLDRQRIRCGDGVERD